MAKNSPYLEFLMEQFAPLGQINVRAMFGGHCLYCEGITFALVAGQSVFLKADEVNRPLFEERGLSPFRPFPESAVVMQYFPAPAETFESMDGLRKWAGGAVEAGVRAQKRISKPRAKPKTLNPLGSSPTQS